MIPKTFGRLSPTLVALLVAMFLLGLFGLQELATAAETSGRLVAEAAVSVRDRVRNQALGAARTFMAAQRDLRSEVSARAVQTPRELHAERLTAQVGRLKGWLEFRLQLLASWLRGQRPVMAR